MEFFMRGVIVAIDLETTGLDYATDRIIEIGAVKFQGSTVLETFSTLVDPEMKFPAKITAITGIRPDMLIGAPKIDSVLPGLSAFVGDAPVLGHNIEFDLHFLNRHNVVMTNESLDTYELASVLLPAAPRYNLNALMQLLNLEPEGDYHRALADAHATMRVYNALWHKLLTDMPLALLQEIMRASESLSWRGYPAFAAAFAERKNQADSKPDGIAKSVASTPAPAPIQPRTPPQPIAIDKLTAFAPELHTTINAVTRAFNEGTHLILEGAAASYLPAAIVWSAQNGEHVILATATDKLRETLIQRDIPAISAALGIPVHTSVMQSRADYLCPRRLATMRRIRPTSIEELRVLAKIQVWLHESNSDDCSPVNMRGPAEQITWGRLTAQDELCGVSLCESRMAGICPFYKANRAAQGAEIVIIDQALLITDAMSGDHVLPDYRYLIIDEGHRLEDSVTYGLGSRLDLLSIKQRFANLGTESTGLIGGIAGAMDALQTHDKPVMQIRGFVHTLAEAVEKMGYHTDNLFKALVGFLTETDNLNTGGEFLMQVRLTHNLREKMAFNQVRSALSTLSEFTSAIAEALEKLSRRLGTLEGTYTIADLDDLVRGTEAGARHLNEMYRHLNNFVTSPDSNMIYWIDIGQDVERLTLRMAPLQVAPLIQQHLWNQKKTIILCGETLRVGGSFEFIQTRLGGSDMLPAAVAERPFREDRPIMAYLPNDMPDPQERKAYQQAIEKGIIELAMSTEGRMLVVFTSFNQLRQATQNMAARLALGNITAFDQADGTSRQVLIEGFRATPRSVLFGTPSLWEGIDTPFAPLTTLVIVRLPFAVPNDPVVAARSELYKSSFDQFMVPDAVLRFRDEIGTLINARSDRSLIALFDKRLTSKAYGQTFLDCLPPHNEERGPMEAVGKVAKAWLTPQ
jgi:DNA polymerase-3 subunit epsilon/ATP-dependent DNA helicase DinG